MEQITEEYVERYMLESIFNHLAIEIAEKIGLNENEKEMTIKRLKERINYMGNIFKQIPAKITIRRLI